jgi:hypothetical protein
MTDSSPLQRKLHNWQMLLLDLTRANRLLYFKPERGSSVPITSPAAADLFQELVVQGKRLTFPTADEKVEFETEEEEHPERSEAESKDASPATAISQNTTPQVSPDGIDLPALSPVPSDPPASQDPQQRLDFVVE